MKKNKKILLIIGIGLAVALFLTGMVQSFIIQGLDNKQNELDKQLEDLKNKQDFIENNSHVWLDFSNTSLSKEN